MNIWTLRSVVPAAFASALLLASVPAQAGLVLTAQGVTDGFNLSLFVDRVPASNCPCGPLGIATNNLGQVVMQDYPNGRNYIFNDIDNQHFSDALSSQPFSSFSYGVAITNLGGQLYAGNQDLNGTLHRLNANGSDGGQVPGTANFIAGHGIWTAPNGHIISGEFNGIWDTDPTTGVSRQIESTNDVDGVSVSPDGKTVYGATGGQIIGWDYAGLNSVVYVSGGIGSPDGTGVIQGASLFAGDIIANGNDGNVWLLDPILHTNVLIATGGSRGDYVGVDSTNGSLFLTQSDSVYRLTCGPGCVFTSVTGTVPEPSSVLLMLAALLGFGWTRRRLRLA